MKRKTTERNRKIYSDFRTGKTVSQLAENYGLAAVTVKFIVRTERYKLEVSVDEFYRALRQTREPEPQP